MVQNLKTLKKAWKLFGFSNKESILERLNLICGGAHWWINPKAIQLTLIETNKKVPNKRAPNKSEVIETTYHQIVLLF